MVHAHPAAVLTCLAERSLYNFYTYSSVWLVKSMRLITYGDSNMQFYKCGSVIVKVAAWSLKVAYVIHGQMHVTCTR